LRSLEDSKLLALVNWHLLVGWVKSLENLAVKREQGKQAMVKREVEQLENWDI